MACMCVCVHVCLQNLSSCGMFADRNPSCLNMSLVMRKPVKIISEQQTRRSAFVVHCLDSIIPLVSISKISSL